MSEAVERPSVRWRFRWIVATALGLALLALLGGREVYVRYGGYRPLALVHVPASMRYRARVELGDAARLPALARLLSSLDPRGVRLAALERRLGVQSAVVARELAFGAGPGRDDFVLVFGLQLQAGTGLATAKSVCETLREDGIRSEPTDNGCRLAGGAVLGVAPDGSLVLGSREPLVKDWLSRPEIGDRLGFSGPSVRGAAPDPAELAVEAGALAELIRARYP